MKPMLRLLALLATVYAGLVAWIALKQRSLIYLPTRASTAELSRLAGEHEFQAWTNAAGARIGWWRPSRLSPATGAVLIAHGNAGSAAEREYLADPLQEALPLDVFLLEYPGYGDRPGEPSEATLNEAAREGIRPLLARSGKLYLVGESLGTGVTAFLAGQFPEQVSGVCLLAPYNNLAAAASSHYPWLPVRWMLRDRFPADAHLRRYHGPLAILVAGSDSIIPPQLARTLYDGYTGGPKRQWEFPGQEHWDVISQPAPVWAEVGSFWRVETK